MRHRLHHSVDDSSSTKKWLAELLENRKVELLIVTLVLCDLVLVLIEAGVDHHLFCVGGQKVVCPGDPGGHEVGVTTHPHGHHHHGHTESHHEHTRFLVDSWQAAGRRPAALLSLAAHGLTQAWHEPHDHDHGSGMCPHPGAQILVCDTRDGHHAAHLTHTCHQLSIAILCVFLVELSLKYWVAPAAFLSNFYHKLDLAVTLISLLVDTVVVWIIETYVHEDQEREAEDASLIVGGLVLTCRCWRLVRIGHGIFEEVHAVHEVDEENKKLKKRLTDAGLNEEGSSPSEPPP